MNEMIAIEIVISFQSEEKSKSDIFLYKGALLLLSSEWFPLTCFVLTIYVFYMRGYLLSHYAKHTAVYVLEINKTDNQWMKFSSRYFLALISRREIIPKNMY